MTASLSHFWLYPTSLYTKAVCGKLYKSIDKGLVKNNKRYLPALL